MTVTSVADLPIGKILGVEFDSVGVRSWLISWSERFMGLAPSAARGWRSDGNEVISGALGWEPAQSDWLEIDVDPKRRPQGHAKCPGLPDPVLSVVATLSVACWCRDNHNAHYVEERHEEVGTTEALVEACEAVLSAGESWISTSSDPEEWRRRAGLVERIRSQDLTP